jgi:uncharacterized membrane protein HdeD (DUF308 family)
MTSDARTSDVVRDAARTGVREATGIWWWFLILGVLWTGLGMFVLSYRVGSLAVVAALVGAALLFGGVAQLVVAGRVRSWRWLFIVSGVLGVAAGIGTFVWPGVTLYVVSMLVAWYLIVFGIVHLIGALAGPRLAWWWTGLLLGAAELGLGVWAAHSWQRSLVTLVTLVGVWAIVHGANEIFAAFTVRQVGRQAEQLVG